MITTWKDLNDHARHTVEPDLDDLGEMFVVCRDCDEVLSDEATHGDRIDPLADYYKAVNASSYWPAVKEAFPVEDSDDS